MTAAELPRPRTAHLWLRLLLVAVAALEFLDAVTAVRLVFTGFDATTTTQKLIAVKLVLAVPVTGAALFFALTGRVRPAIVALAAIVLLTFTLTDVWAITINGV